MSRILAILAAGTVANVILGDLESFPEAIDITELSPRPGPGWTYANGSFSPPALAEPPAPTSYFIPEDEFMDRWTTEELVAFYSLKQTDALLQVGDALVSRLKGIRNDAQRTQALMGYLVQQGVLTHERVAVLLAPPAGAA